MLTMTRTEAIPYDSMKADMNWDWETIPEYLDSLDRTAKGVNCVADLAFLEKLAATARRPILHNVIVAARKDPKVHRRSLDWLERCWKNNLPIYGQTGTHRTGFAFTLEHWNLYDASPAWRELTTGSKTDKLAKMKNPALREAVKHETEEADRKLQVIQAGVGGPIPKLIVQKPMDVRSYTPTSENHLARSPNQDGKHPIDVMLGPVNLRRPERGISGARPRCATRGVCGRRGCVRSGRAGHRTQLDR